MEVESLKRLHADLVGIDHDALFPESHFRSLVPELRKEGSDGEEDGKGRIEAVLEGFRARLVEVEGKLAATG